eukprot:NODE_9443_length_591_cov_35.619658_g8808_i0.p1 GENE.NODE_9443_length_591_cov_35.619658_g8808_i0~~NODE_9443_length_591_cov_35.619658_g8808_i0.p1  ORF type:complete len:180 (+),score=42.69 NODE_9443_length_591_cov_35.619658_g8808_i0:60-542(+)
MSLPGIADLNTKLAGLKTPYLDGKNPGDPDRKAFQELIGKDNIHLWRWVKHIASYSEEERKAWADAEKAALVAKSSIVLDVKPWDDETDLIAMESAIRALEIPGLHWGASKQVAVAFGIKKIQIMLTIEDELVSSDDIEDAVTGLEDYVQSIDIVSWNKL